MGSKLLSPLISSCVLATSAASLASTVPYTSVAPVIDGINSEAAWQRGKWQTMNHAMDGSVPEPADFSGRYRLLWDQDYLYLQAEIQDDVLYDAYPDPLVGYWSDDCLEVFVDENASGGDHQYNHTAFAYHISLDNQVVDIDADKSPILLNDHITSRWQRQLQAPHTITWEAAIALYPESFTTANPGKPVKLTAGKNIGFMLYYCDNDGSEVREHFMGFPYVPPKDGSQNRGWIDASVFETLRLVK